MQFLQESWVAIAMINFSVMVIAKGNTLRNILLSPDVIGESERDLKLISFTYSLSVYILLFLSLEDRRMSR